MPVDIVFFGIRGSDGYKTQTKPDQTGANIVTFNQTLNSKSQTLIPKLFEFVLVWSHPACSSSSIVCYPRQHCWAVAEEPLFACDYTFKYIATLNTRKCVIKARNFMYLCRKILIMHLRLKAKVPNNAKIRYPTIRKQNEQQSFWLRYAKVCMCVMWSVHVCVKRCAYGACVHECMCVCVCVCVLCADHVWLFQKQGITMPSRFCQENSKGRWKMSKARWWMDNCGLHCFVWKQKRLCAEPSFSLFSVNIYTSCSRWIKMTMTGGLGL